MSLDIVRSKFDQSTGDPSGFYHKHGYVRSGSKRPGKKQNIELFVKKDDLGRGAGQRGENGESAFDGSAESVIDATTRRRRTVDVMAEKLDLGNFHPERF